jgi:hypothetical protein
LGPDWLWCAADYESCDFRHKAGARLEVKQSAALQTWNAASQRVTKASFDIATRTGEWVDGVQWKDRIGRNADTYVFAYHPVTDHTADHREPAQWQFYVVLEERLPEQKTLALSVVADLSTRVGFSELRESVQSALFAFSGEKS